MRTRLFTALREAQDLRRRLRLQLTRRRRTDVLYDAISTGVDDRLVPILRYVLLDELRPGDRAVVQRVEALRRALAQEEGALAVYGSPAPGSAGTVDAPVDRAAPGTERRYTTAWLASLTSKHRFPATILYLLSNYWGARSVLELGACVGVSGAYLCGGHKVERFISVEASAELAAVADRTVKAILPSAEVRHGLFHEEIDRLLGAKVEPFDLVYIDGHHEKIATLQYFERLRPLYSSGSLIVFDDIYWSKDMNEAWRILQDTPGFELAVDLGHFGACVWTGGDVKPALLDLSPYTSAGGGWATGHATLRSALIPRQ